MGELQSGKSHGEVRFDGRAGNCWGIGKKPGRYIDGSHKCPLSSYC